jgi:hypothetical protein
LRSLGLLRRAAHPPDELVRELLVANAGRLNCDQCRSVGLVISARSNGDFDVDFDGEGEGDWQQAVTCEVCRVPIPPERLAVFADARRCVGCQDVADRGESPDEPEFCEKCGSLVELRVSHAGGMTRYKRFCTGIPACRL